MLSIKINILGECEILPPSTHLQFGSNKFLQNFSKKKKKSYGVLLTVNELQK